MSDDLKRDAFVNRWKTHLAGLAIYGSTSELRDGPLAKASKWYEIPDQVERLLGLMWDHMLNLTDKPLPVKPVEQSKPNGTAPRVPVKT